jgi:DeoR/GlpR family transcriptional regulator of sugar metabolism
MSPKRKRKKSGRISPSQNDIDRGRQLERGLAVLRFLTTNEPAGVAAIAAALPAWNPRTIRRDLGVLERLQYITKTENHQWKLNHQPELQTEPTQGTP